MMYNLKEDFFVVKNKRKVIRDTYNSKTISKVDKAKDNVFQILAGVNKIYGKKYNTNEATKLLFLFFILLFLPIYLNKEIKYRKLIFTFDITITINKSGTHKILCDSFTNLPNEISINGNPPSVIKNEYELESENNTIIMKWDSDLGNCNNMFNGLSNIDSIEFSNFESTNILEMTSMFNGCSSIKSLDFSNFDTSKVAVMNYIFNGCSSLESISFGNDFTKSVNNMDSMFRGCSSLESIDLSKFNTSNAVNMNFMFAGCSKLTNLDLTGFNTEKVIDMPHMFEGCSSLVSLDLSNWDVRKVITMTSMFMGCRTLTNLNLNFAYTTESLTNIPNMFEGCSSLISLDLSNWDVRKVVNMAAMFLGCASLTDLNLNFAYTTESLTNMVNIFNGCSELLSIDLSKYNTSKVADFSGLFSNCKKLVSLDLSNFNTNSLNSLGETFMNCESLESLDINHFNANQVTNMRACFLNCKNLRSLDLSNFETPNLIEMWGTFKDCSSLEVLKVNNFNDEKVTDMSMTFQGCSSLISLDLSSFKASSATTIYHLFEGCTALKSLNMSNFVADKITDFGVLFSNCKSLESLDLSSFKTDSATSMWHMFEGCTSLKYLDISNFNTESVNTMESMFFNCNSLTSLNLNNFNTENVNNMASMFYNCYSLNKLDIDQFNPKTVTTMYNMFYNCSSLRSLNLTNFNTQSVQNMENMFCDCNSLEYLDLSSFNTQSATTMASMFSNCKYLTSINLQSFDTSNVNNLANMFNGCSSLTSLDINHFNITSVTSFERMLYGCHENLIYCFKEEIINENFKNELNNYENNCLDICILQSNKYINETKECIQNCQDSDYKYDYQNLCYISCPKGSHKSSEDSFFCEEELVCEHYYNSDKTDCYDEIPPGYYENDPFEKTVVKCSNECSECDLSSTQNNLCKECNTNEGYYPKYNDSNNISPYINCYNTEQTGYYIDNSAKIYKPCYSTCKKCEESGSFDNNNCIECIDDNYEFNNGNCIEHPDSTYVEKNDNPTTNLDIKTNINEPFNNPSTNLEITTNINESTNILELTESIINSPIYSDTSQILEQNIIQEITSNIDKDINFTSDNYKYFYEVNEDINKIKNLYTNNTFIDITKELLEFLVEKFHLDKNEKLYILINDYPSEKSNKATTDYDYRIFLENGTELNLSEIKEDIYVDIYVPITDLDLINYNYSKHFAEQGYDIYDKNSDFYNDVCTPASIGKSDIVLKDRRKDIYPNNVTLCEEGCTYNGINIEEERIICSCNLNGNKNNTDEAEDDFLKEDDGNFLTYFLDNINYKIFKCYSLFASFKNLKNNYAFYTISGIYAVILILNLIFRFYSFKNFGASMLEKIPSVKKNQNEENLLPKERRKTSALNVVKNNPNKRKKTLDNRGEHKKKIKKKKKKIKNHNSTKLLNINSYNNINNINDINKDVIKTGNDYLLENNLEKDKKKSSRKTINENPNDMNNETNNQKLDKKDINELTYNKAIIYDKRNIFQIFGSLFIEKLELINIFCGNEKFKIILICEYILSLLLNFFFNTLLYSDDVISDNYHNNGELDYFVSLVLSLLSNIITSIILYYIKFSKGIDERIELILDLKSKNDYIRNLIIYNKYLRLKFICFFIGEIFIVSGSFYYIVIFCIVYNSSKVNIIINYLLSLVESLITALIISIIISITRKIGLYCKNKYFYNTSKYINDKF